MDQSRMKTGKVTNYVDKIFIADISGVKTIDNFKDILYDVFYYGNDIKTMFVNADIYRNNIKKYFVELYPKQEIYRGEWRTGYGDINTVIYFEDRGYNNLLIFLDKYSNDTSQKPHN